MSYELWNARTGNLVGGYDSEQEALAAVRLIVREHGEAYAQRFVLGHEDRQGKTRMLASGEDLVRLAGIGERTTSAMATQKRVEVA